jgi:hypothetical protein
MRLVSSKLIFLGRSQLVPTRSDFHPKESVLIVPFFSSFCPVNLYVIRESEAGPNRKNGFNEINLCVFFPSGERSMDLIIPV